MFQKIEIINPFFAIEGFGFVIEIIFFFNSDSIPIFVDSHTLLNSFFKSSKNSTCDTKSKYPNQKKSRQFFGGEKSRRGILWLGESEKKANKNRKNLSI